MKYLQALLAVFFPLVMGNESGCISDVDESVDYFPNKVSPEESTQWTIQYENTYKILSNINRGETYLLYQCGSTPPEDHLDGRHSAVVSVPVEGVALSSTTQIPFIEILGARSKIAAFLGEYVAPFVSSPCTGMLFDEGAIVEILDAANASSIEEYLNLTVFGGGTAFENEISISLSDEDENLAAFEWVKFYSTFFNLEETANMIYNETRDRYTCAEDNANLLACDSETTPVVLWASYSGYCGGWDVATCPNYYCEFAEGCQAEILNSDTQGSLFSDACGRNYMTTEEFMEFGKDADVWIYTSTNFEDMLSEFGDNMTDFVSIQNQEVYDTQGSGANAWFEQRLAEPGRYTQWHKSICYILHLIIHVVIRRCYFAGLLLRCRTREFGSSDTSPTRMVERCLHRSYRQFG